MNMSKIKIEPTNSVVHQFDFSQNQLIERINEIKQIQSQNKLQKAKKKKTGDELQKKKHQSTLQCKISNQSDMVVPQFLQPISEFTFPQCIFSMMDKDRFTDRNFDGFFTTMNKRFKLNKVLLKNKIVLLEMLTNPNQNSVLNVEVLIDRLKSLNNCDAYHYACQLQQFQLLVAELIRKGQQPTKPQQDIQQQQQSEEEFDKLKDDFIESIVNKYPFQGFRMIFPHGSQQLQSMTVYMSYMMLFVLFHDIDEGLKHIINHGIPGIFQNLTYFQFMADFFRSRMRYDADPTQDQYENIVILKFPDNSFRQFWIRIKYFSLLTSTKYELNTIYYFVPKTEGTLLSQEQFQQLNQNEIQKQQIQSKYDELVQIHKSRDLIQFTQKYYPKNLPADITDKDNAQIRSGIKLIQ